jgi:hypothetical protein
LAGRIRILTHHLAGLTIYNAAAKGQYVMTGGQDRVVKLWNPFRSDVEDLEKAFLIQTYTGAHGYEVGSGTHTAAGTFLLDISATLYL